MDNLTALDDLLPEAIKERIVKRDDGLAFRDGDIEEILRLAEQNQIAVLGIKVLEVSGGVTSMVGFSGYDLEIPYKDEWEPFYQKNNEYARQFVENSSRSDNTIYVLTSASKEEFVRLNAG